jgi:hypothetical protein
MVNTVQETRSIIRTVDSIMTTQIRDWLHEKNPNRHNEALGFGFSIRYDAFAGRDDRNNEFAVIQCAALVTGFRCMFVGLDVFDTYSGRDRADTLSDFEWKMTGSHSSCWDDGWENRLMDTCEKVIIELGKLNDGCSRPFFSPSLVDMPFRERIDILNGDTSREEGHYLMRRLGREDEFRVRPEGMDIQ